MYVGAGAGTLSTNGEPKTAKTKKEPKLERTKGQLLRRFEPTSFE